VPVADEGWIEVMNDSDDDDVPYLAHVYFRVGGAFAMADLWNFVTDRSEAIAAQRRVAPDVALLQEVKVAHWPTALIPVARLDGRERESATGIDAPAFSVELLGSGTIGSAAPKGAFTAARIAMPATLDLVAVSVYAQINRGLAYPTAQAIVKDLEPLLRSSAAERLLVGGRLQRLGPVRRHGGRPARAADLASALARP
jgi:hypothetical protein